MGFEFQLNDVSKIFSRFEKLFLLSSLKTHLKLMEYKNERVEFFFQYKREF